MTVFCIMSLWHQSATLMQSRIFNNTICSSLSMTSTIFFTITFVYQHWNFWLILDRHLPVDQELIFEVVSGGQDSIFEVVSGGRKTISISWIILWDLQLSIKRMIFFFCLHMFLFICTTQSVKKFTCDPIFFCLLYNEEERSLFIKSSSWIFQSSKKLNFSVSLMSAANSNATHSLFCFPLWHVSSLKIAILSSSA